MEKFLKMLNVKFVLTGSVLSAELHAPSLTKERVKINTMHKDRHIDQWNRIESSEINLHMFCKLIVDKDTQTMQWEK